MKKIINELKRLKKEYDKYPKIEYDAGVAYGINISIRVIKEHLKKIYGDKYIEIFGDEL